MNGLKYLRIKCNYSQKAVAEKLNVSRQAVNMWEHSKKFPSKEHKEALCSLFGIDSPEFLGELTFELYNKLETSALYEIPPDGESRRYSFKRIETGDWKNRPGLLSFPN